VGWVVGWVTAVVWCALQSANLHRHLLAELPPSLPEVCSGLSAASCQLSLELPGATAAGGQAVQRREAAADV
jgi:hypothetical protein